jgi:rhodanese-related sulfurtransferase
MATRNATVTMLTEGVLVRLPRNAFVDYVQDALVTWVSPTVAQKKVAEGAQYLDVRTPKEMSRQHLRGAMSFPLKDLRERVDELDKETLYICYDQKGRLSATAAFLLRQHGYNVAVVEGGLRGFQR